MRLIAILCLTATAFGEPFPLTDSGPAASDFKERFFGSYGVNPQIEPQISTEARELYQRIEPLLRERPREALAEVEVALARQSDPALHFLRGNLLYQIGEYEEAVGALQLAVEGFPSFRRAYRTLGLIAIEAERFGDAVEHWLEVIRLGGGDAQSYGLLGYAHLSLGRYQSALVAYRHARMFQPDSVDFRRGEARCLLSTGQLKEAIALFDELLAESPETIDYWLLQANAYLENEAYEDAIANLEVARSSEGASAEVLQLLGDLYLRQENHRLALAAYEEALDRFPVEGVEAALRPLDYLVRANLVDEAASYLGRLRERLPGAIAPAQRRRLELAEAAIAVERGEWEAARATLKSVVEADPLAGDALLLLAETYLREESWPDAEFYLERALSVPERQRDALIALGRMEVSRGRFGAALERLRAAQSLADTANLATYIERVERARPPEK